MSTQQAPTLTEAVYRFICGYIAEQGIAPSVRDIARGCYASRGGVMRCLDHLEARGLISRLPGVPRGIRLEKSGHMSAT